MVRNVESVVIFITGGIWVVAMLEWMQCKLKVLIVSQEGLWKGLG
jgi:hypothetical protein